MASIEENLTVWGNDYDWKQAGEEWSAAWGGADMQWYFTILPRIHAFVPKQTILEIAPGFGRWTQFLAPLCEKLIVVDLSDKCIQHCKNRFKSYSHLNYHVNDGKSLEMIPDESIDFLFSFDSLVHAEADVIEEYLKQIRVKLKRDGVGFIHHSNIGAYKTFFSFNDRLNKMIRNSRLKKTLCRLGMMESHDHFRARSMTADIFKRIAAKYDLECQQEIINWGTKRLIDCFSIIKKKGAKPSLGQVLRNKAFMTESAYIHKLAKLYTDGF
jgi:SAM-dependent methyltransferase